MSTSKLEAKQRIEKALGDIERAQNHLLNACESLSRINGACDEWERIGKVYDTVKASWYVVRNLSFNDSLDLDSDAKRTFEARKSGAR